MVALLFLANNIIIFINKISIYHIKRTIKILVVVKKKEF